MHGRPSRIAGFSLDDSLISLCIAPDLVTWAGFELGAGMPINPSQPEKDAVVLRVADGFVGQVHPSPSPSGRGRPG